MESLLFDLVCLVVTQPQAVKVTQEERPNGSHYALLVSPADFDILSHDGEKIWLSFKALFGSMALYKGVSLTLSLAKDSSDSMVDELQLPFK